MRQLRFTLITACLAAAIAAVNGGVVFTKDHKMTVGELKEDGDSLRVKVKYGFVRYHKDNVAWYSNHPKVTNLLMAGRLAEHQGKKQIAKLFYRESMKREAANKQKAKILLNRILDQERQKREALAKKLALAEPEPEPDKEEEAAAKNDNPTVPLSDHVVYQAFKGKLEYLKGKSLRRYDAKDMAAAKRYLLYYSASWCPPCQAFTPKLVELYNEKRKECPNQLEVILVSSDRKEADMKDYMAEKHMPWPAVKFSKRDNIDLVRDNSPSAIPHLVTLDPEGKVLATGIKSTLALLRKESIE